MSGIFESLGIDSGIIIIILLILTVYLLIRNVNSNMRLSRLERRYKVFMKGSDAQSLEKVFVRKFAQIDRLYEAKDQHDHELLFIKKNLDKMFSKYGVEKYDAFDDVGGKLSFALALLDAHGQATHDHAVGHVVAITDEPGAQPGQPALAFPHGHQVGQDTVDREDSISS